MSEYYFIGHYYFGRNCHPEGLSVNKYIRGDADHGIQVPGKNLKLDDVRSKKCFSENWGPCQDRDTLVISLWPRL